MLVFGSEFSRYDSAEKMFLYNLLNVGEMESIRDLGLE